jgi:hypothetical protein
MAVDGVSHFFSDLSGIGQGFRVQNLWLVSLTQQMFSPAFYAGEAWGSFNSLMRLLSGILFGIGIVWYTYPYLDKAFAPQDSPMAARLMSEQKNQLGDPLHEYKE